MLAPLFTVMTFIEWHTPSKRCVRTVEREPIFTGGEVTPKNERSERANRKPRNEAGHQECKSGAKNAT